MDLLNVVEVQEYRLECIGDAISFNRQGFRGRNKFGKSDAVEMIQEELKPTDEAIYKRVDVDGYHLEVDGITLEERYTINFWKQSSIARRLGECEESGDSKLFIMNVDEILNYTDRDIQEDMLYLG